MKQTMIVGSDGSSNYSITDATRNITITGLPFTLEAIQVAYVFNQTQALLLYAPIDGFPAVTVSGGVITYDSTKAALATGDVIHIQLYPPDYGTDADGYPLVRVLNPEYAHNTSPEALVTEEDQANAAVSRYVIPFEDYKNASLQFSLYAATADDTVTVTLWATNDEDADDTADTSWVDASVFLLGGASFTATNTTTNEIIFWDSQIVALKFMVKVVYVYGGGGSANNSCDVVLKKA